MSSETNLHISPNPSAKRTYLTNALVLIAVIVGLYIVSRFNYPLFHSLADMATVFIAIGVFVLVWTRRRLLDNHFYLFVGIAFLFFAFWDALHLLGNKGMGVFPQYGNLGPALYIVSRYFLGISLLIAPLFIKRKLNTTIAFGAYAAVSVLVLLSVFYWQNFPTTYIDRVGLTSFKVTSDYLICVLLAVATGLLFVNRRALDARVFRFFTAALIFFIATGLAFTLYTDPFGATNAIGHFFQITSFYLVYLAFLETIMLRPQDILYRNLTQSRENALKLNTDLENVNIRLKEEITERQKTEDDLKRSEQKYRSLTENLPDVITRYDRDLRHIYVNSAAGKVAGLAPEAFIGKTNLELGMDPEQVEFWMKHVRKVFETGEPDTMEFSFNAADGLRYQQTLITPEFDEKGLVKTVLCITHNLTELKKVDESLRRYASELEVANEELESFSYSVSHDLKAPLRGIDGFSAVLLEEYMDKLDDQGKEYLRHVRQSSQVMGRLIDDMLRLSRTTRADLTVEKVDLSEIVSLIADELKQSSPGRAGEFVIAPQIVAKGDFALITILLRNLLDNAWKYSEKSPSTRIEFGVDEHQIPPVYYVKDNGIGFNMQYSDKLFKPFNRLHSADEYSGSGIGLAIAQRIVRRHGGRIWAQGEIGKGATFYFTLP